MFDARVKLVCLAAYVIAALHAHTPAAMGVCVVAAVVLAFATGLTPRSVGAAIRPLAAILMVTAVMQFLYLPDRALEATVVMVVGLVCVMVASIAFMRTTPTAQLVSAFNWTLAPLRAFGVRTAPFMLSLSVAFRFVPVLVGDFNQLKSAQRARLASFDGSVRQRVMAYARLFPPLVRGSFRRADQLALGFVSRCFSNEAMSGSLHPAQVRLVDFALIALAAAVAVASFAL